MRQVVITKGEDNHWVAECPSLPGCISQGVTKEEAVTNIKEAIELYQDELWPNAAASFRDGRRDVKAGRIHPVETLWDDDQEPQS